MQPLDAVACLLLTSIPGMKSFLARLQRKRTTIPIGTTKTPVVPSVSPTIEKPAPPPIAEPPTPAPRAEPPPVWRPASTPAARGAAGGYSIELQLGDFLDRIPPAYLKPEKFDRSLALHFELAEIARHFNESNPKIRLVEIYRRLPDIFTREVTESDAVAILLPWQRIIDMVMAGEGEEGFVSRLLLRELTPSVREQRAAKSPAPVLPSLPPAAPVGRRPFGPRRTRLLLPGFPRKRCRPVR